MTNDKIEKFSMDFILSFKMFDRIIIGYRTKKHFNDLVNNLGNIKVLKKSTLKKIIEINKTNYYFSSSNNKYNN